MNAIIQTLRNYFDSFLHSSFVQSLLSSPRRLAVYAAIVAILLISIPLLRLLFRSRRRSEDEEDAPIGTSYPSMFGLATPVDRQPARREAWSEPAPMPMPASAPMSSAPMSNVTAINQSLTVPCTHCGATMSARQDFCPACGYAQPMKQSVTA